MQTSRLERTIFIIIFSLPIEKIDKEHLEILSMALQSDSHSGLIDSEIGEMAFPKLINSNATNLLLKLLEIILDFKRVDAISSDKFVGVIDSYWLYETLEKYKPEISRLCALKAAEVAVNKMRQILDEDKSQFNNVWIPTIEDHPQTTFHDRYQCQLVHFVRDMFVLTEATQVRTRCKQFLDEEHPIFKRIAIHLINFHYEKLNDLFWGFDRNPLEESLVKHELFELFKSRCESFTETQIEQAINWIESKDYYIPDEIKGDADEIKKICAYRKREWLSALLGTGDQRVKNSFEKYYRINPTPLRHPGLDFWMESRAGTVSPLDSVDLLTKSNAEIADYLKTFKEKSGWEEPSYEGLAFTFRTCVANEPSRFANNLEPFLDIPHLYQYSLLSGLNDALNKGKTFRWDTIFDYISIMLETGDFWNDREDRIAIVHRIAELISDGTKSDKNAFNETLLPQAEDILLILAENVQSDLVQMTDLQTAVLNSSKGKIFSAMISYSLRCARLSKTKGTKGWVERIRKYFELCLNRDTEPSLEFSVILGQYLFNLIYLDRSWVIDNINNIFPKENEEHWTAAFSGYLFFTRRLDKDVYFLLRKNEHYGKALTTDFSDRHISEHLVQHICVGYLEGWEELEDPTSLIAKLIAKEDISQLSEVVNFLWRPRDQIVDKTKQKIKALWRQIVDLVSQKQEDADCQNLISNLSKWLVLVDEVDEEVSAWLKLSAKYVNKNFNSAHFIEYLAIHARKTPKKVGEIYLEILNADFFPDYKKESIQEIIRTLYEEGEKGSANKICNMYGERGFNFLKDLFDKHRDDNQ